ncbi:hypothetical protein [Modestobacter sp. URMC 112]
MGTWRLIEGPDRHGVPATVPLDSDVCTRCPQVMEAGRERG